MIFCKIQSNFSSETGDNFIIIYETLKDLAHESFAINNICSCQFDY